MYGESLHEAGYDSMLTAVLFLKLSVRMHLQKPAMPRWAMGSLGRMQLQFAHPQSYDAQELFDSLMNARSGQADSEESDLMDFTDSVDCVAYLPTPIDSTPAPAEPEDTVANMVSNGVLLPRFDAEFWTTYGNKVRIFGTHEGVMDLVTRDKV
jgi:poly(A)-specific ribonuclease